MLKRKNRVCLESVKEAFPTMIGTLRPAARRIVRFLGPHYLRLFEGIRDIHFEGEEHFRQALEDFYSADTRLIITFRHVMKEDAPALMYAFMTSRKIGKVKPHALFIYGKDVLHWAGKKAALVFPHLGTIPVENRTLNQESLKALKHAVISGAHPIALAPESQVTYHTGQVAPISNGSAFMAEWATREGKKVAILPVSLYYTYGKPDGELLDEICERWERETGMKLKENADSKERLIEATEKTLSILTEEFPLTFAPDTPLRERLEGMCENVLASGESLAGIRKHGRIIDRVFVLRQAGNDILFDKELKQKRNSPLASSLLDMNALKGHLILRHEKVADILEYIDPEYITDSSDTHRLCEYGLNLLDLVNRMAGGTIDTRFSPKRKSVSIMFGEMVPLKAEKGAKRKEQTARFSQEIYEALQRVSEEHEVKKR